MCIGRNHFAYQPEGRHLLGCSCHFLKREREREHACSCYFRLCIGCSCCHDHKAVLLWNSMIKSLGLTRCAWKLFAWLHICFICKISSHFCHQHGFPVFDWRSCSRAAASVGAAEVDVEHPHTDRSLLATKTDTKTVSVEAEEDFWNFAAFAVMVMLTAVASLSPCADLPEEPRLL